MRYSLLLICLVWLGAGCATPNRARHVEEGGDVYPDDQVGSFVAATDPGVRGEYVLGVGDRIDVNFFFHSDLTTNDLLVRPDGRITLPYVGDVLAVGYTPMQLDTLLTNQFSEILKEPNVSVIVRSTEDPMVYVTGVVDRPGGYSFKRTLSLTQALALAGGFDRGAHTKQVIVLRRESLDRIVGVQVDVQAIFDGNRLQDDIALRNMDVVYVPKTALEGTAEVMQAVSDIIQPFRDAVFGAWQVILIRETLSN
jgi:polysaccharide export outer membrane protein